MNGLCEPSTSQQAAQLASQECGQGLQGKVRRGQFHGGANSNSSSYLECGMKLLAQT